MAEIIYSHQEVKAIGTMIIHPPSVHLEKPESNEGLRLQKAKCLCFRSKQTSPQSHRTLGIIQEKRMWWKTE